MSLSALVWRSAWVAGRDFCFRNAMSRMIGCIINFISILSIDSGTLSALSGTIKVIAYSIGVIKLIIEVIKLILTIINA